MGGKTSGSWVGELIDTPAGRMTRREASKHSGIPFGTICRRVWMGCPVNLLFATRGELRYKGALKRPKRLHNPWNPKNGYNLQKLHALG